jgi:DNA-binding transcriptional ArsR family regulator
MQRMDTFHALAEPTRRQIVEMLAREGALTAGDIQARFSVSAPAISQHLKVLREAGLVRVEKRAQQRIYSVNPEAMLEMEAWARRVRQLWAGRFDALEALLREEQSKSTEE